MRRLIRFVSAAMAMALTVALTPTGGAYASPLDERQWWIDSWAVEELVWPRTKGEGVTVAVLDTGVEASLPDLRDAVVPGKAFRMSGDGRTDTSEDGDVGHGTAMASLIASRGTGTGFMGIAPEATIMPLVNPGISDSSTPRAIRYAVDHGAKIVSISRGSSPGSYPHQCAPRLLDAIAYAAKKDVIVVAAAGNEAQSGNTPISPASCPGVVAVGAMDNRGEAWESSQRQDYVTLSAPGVNIPALSQDGRVWPNGNGTSHATALAAGAFALLRSEFPEKSAREIVQLAVNTAKDFGPPGKDKKHGYGTLSLRTALSEQVPASAPAPVYDRLDRVLARTEGGTDGKESEPGKQARADDGAGTGDAERAEAAGAAVDSAAMSPLVLVTGGAIAVGVAVLLVVLVVRRGRKTD